MGLPLLVSSFQQTGWYSVSMRATRKVSRHCLSWQNDSFGCVTLAFDWYQLIAHRSNF